MISFSIIIPVYKGQQYIPNLIRIAEANARELDSASIENNVELILVNDSPDIPLEIETESRTVTIRPLANEHNSGIHQSRINGLQAATGEYIVFLDQDDQIADDFLTKLYTIAIEKKADVVVGNAVNEISEQVSMLAYRTKGLYRNVTRLEAYVVSRNQIISPGQCLIRKASIPQEWCQFVVKINGADDLFLWLLMMVLGRKFEICKDVVYTHRYTGENLSAAIDKMTNSSLEVGQYLQQISYVPKRVTEDFIKCCKLHQLFRNASFAEKIVLMLKNSVLFTRRLYVKLSTYF